jgi:hypothetical protein
LKSNATIYSLRTLSYLTDNAEDCDLSLVACGTLPSKILQMHVQYFGDPELSSFLSRLIYNLLSSSQREIVQNLVFYGVMDRIHADLLQPNNAIV